MEIRFAIKVLKPRSYFFSLYDTNVGVVLIERIIYFFNLLKFFMSLINRVNKNKKIVKQCLPLLPDSWKFTIAYSKIYRSLPIGNSYESSSIKYDDQ